MRLAAVQSMIDIKEGDLLIVTGNHAKGPKTQMHTVIQVKVTEKDGTEIILKNKGNVYFNLGMYLDRKSWVTDVQKVIVKETVPQGMKVNFNNLRTSAIITHDALVQKLNDAILKTDQWALPNGVTHGQEMNIKGYVLIDAEELQRDLSNLRCQLGTIASVYEPDNPDFADVYTNPLEEFNPEIE